MNYIEITKEEMMKNVCQSYTEIIWDCGMEWDSGTECAVAVDQLSVDSVKEAIDQFTEILDDIDNNEFRKLFKEGGVYSLLYKTDLSDPEIDKTSIVIFNDAGKIIDTIADNDINFF